MGGFVVFYEDDKYIIYNCVSCGKHFIRRNKKTNVQILIPNHVAMTYLSLRVIGFTDKEILSHLKVTNDRM